MFEEINMMLIDESLPWFCLGGFARDTRVLLLSYISNQMLYLLVFPLLKYIKEFDIFHCPVFFPNYTEFLMYDLNQGSTFSLLFM